MIIRVHLTKTGLHKTVRWLENVGTEEIFTLAVLIECESVLLDRVAMNEPPFYELGGQFTRSRNPEIIHFSPEDLDIERIKDEGEN